MGKSVRTPCAYTALYSGVNFLSYTVIERIKAPFLA